MTFNAEVQCSSALVIANASALNIDRFEGRHMARLNSLEYTPHPTPSCDFKPSVYM